MGDSTVRAGYCPQARYRAPAAWVLMLFAVIYRNETTNRFFKKLFYYIPIYSVVVVVYQVLNPFTLYQSATHTNLNRPGLMFQQWSNLHFSLPDFLPSFVKVPGNFRYLPNLVFFVLVVVFIIVSLMKIKEKRLKFWPPVLFMLLFLVMALFPRVPVYNPILLTKGAGLPCKIYGESRYPTRAAERKFPLVDDPSYSFTVSTTRPAPYFVLEFENNETITYNVSISNFDKRLKKETIAVESTRKIYIDNPRYKKYGNNCFYRFHVKVEPPPSRPTLYFQVYPTQKIHK
jgi:hypothetical protein